MGSGTLGSTDRDTPDDGGSTGSDEAPRSSATIGHSDVGEVVAALFSQHNFDALYNCTAGECEFEGLPGSSMHGGGNDGGGGGDREVREA